MATRRYQRDFKELELRRRKGMRMLEVVPIYRHYLKMADVLVFAKARGDVPDFLKHLDGANTSSFEAAANEAEGVLQNGEMVSHAGRWPWGNHETELLRMLAAAADRFWKRYDPSDHTTAPTNQQVIDWLKLQDVSIRVAEVIAQILRADDLPTGPRK